MSSRPPTYYASRRSERRRRARRRGLIVLIVIVVAALAVAVVSPWFGHLGLPWPGGSASSTGTASTGSGGTATVAGITIATDKQPHNGKVLVRFTGKDGNPLAAQWRVDGGDWHTGAIAYVKAPADHSNDGSYVMEVRPKGGGDSVKYAVVVDTKPPELSAVTASPERTDGTGTLKLSFSAPAEKGVQVDWAVVDVLDKPVGEQGKPAPAAGAVTVDWKVPTVDGEKLGPGTYFLRVRATDPGGNVTEERASIACVRPVKARIITDLPAAGKEVALTFDGGSGYAWRSLMNELYSHDSLGTFFCTGVSVDKYPEMAQLTLEQGQTLGNHSYDHPDFATISYAEQVSQLKRNEEAWWKACKAIPQPFFRPPYGSQTPTTVKAAGDSGYRYVVEWNGDAGDWRGIPVSQVVANALAAAKPGAIIVFHTDWDADAALPAVLKGLKAKGLKAVSLAQLCADAGLPY